MNLDKLNPKEKYTIVGAGTIYEIDILCDNLDEIGSKALLVYDKNTKKIAGDIISDALSDYDIQTFVISDANEYNVECAKLLIGRTGREFVIGVGGGKTIDVAKLSSYECNIPWISVPTTITSDAPGSDVASIEEQRGKGSKKAHAPIALIADTNIIINSPTRFIKAGIMDILSNETAVYDYLLSESKFGQKINHEAAEVSFSCAEEIIRKPETFTNKTPSSIEKLVELAVRSGKAMQIAGCSNPASGHEHLTSHMFDKILKEPMMHGEQVGVGAIASKAAYEALDEPMRFSFEKTKSAFKIIDLPTSYHELGRQYNEKTILYVYDNAYKIKKQKKTIADLVREYRMSWKKIQKGRKVI